MDRHASRPPADRFDIKAAIGKRGLTLTEVGRLCDPPVSVQAVSQVLTGDSTSPRIEAALALASGYTLGEIEQVTRSRRDRNDANTDANTRPAKSGRTRASARHDANAHV